MSKKDMKEFQRKKLEAELQKKKKNRKSMDDLQRTIQYMLTENMLNNEEIAALMTSVMYATLTKPSNMKALEGLGFKEITLSSAVKIQEIWTCEYLKTNGFIKEPGEQKKGE